MRVHIYNEDGTIFALNADLREACGDDHEEFAAASLALLCVGRYWIGGGAASLFYLARAD